LEPTSPFTGGELVLHPEDGKDMKIREEELTLPSGDVRLQGTLSSPASPAGLVLFAHGSGSSRLSPRNRYVASILHGFGLATLLFDLLTQEEEELDEVTANLRFDIGLLAARLVQATDWARRSPKTQGQPLGYFGSSTGAAAALVAAAERPEAVAAVVSRGGRPDLAWNSLERVHAPTLLIVGGEDAHVLALNERAYEHMTTTRRLAIVPGATHLFEEAGALQAVARLAGEWLGDHLKGLAPQPFAPAP
jgi:dienelactone hydrolase